MSDTENKPKDYWEISDSSAWAFGGFIIGLVGIVASYFHTVLSLIWIGGFLLIIRALKANEQDSAYQQTRKRRQVIFMCLIVLQFITNLGSLTPAFWRSTEDPLDDIREALFRYQFKNNASALQQDAPAYYLEMEGGKSPSPGFMDRFLGHIPPVKPNSEWQLYAGLNFKIESLSHVTSRSVKAEGGYYEGGLSASGNSYVLIRLFGRWFVVRDRMNWIA